MLKANMKLFILMAIIMYCTLGNAVLSHDKIVYSEDVSEVKQAHSLSSELEDVIFSGYSTKEKRWQSNEKKADLFTGDTIQTESLTINPNTYKLKTEDDIIIARDQIVIKGRGAYADLVLSTMTVQENVQVPEKARDTDLPSTPRVTITCEGPMVIDYKKNFAVFHDNVKVVDKDSIMFANKMHVYFDPETNDMVKAIAFGDVEIITSDKRAVGDHAVYVEKEHTMVLTGNPYVYRENDVITAEKITFYTDDGRMVCEPAAKLVLFPSKKKTEKTEASEEYSPEELDAAVNETIKIMGGGGRGMPL